MPDPVTGITAGASLLGSQGSEKTTTNRMDARFDPIVFGKDGNSGLLGDINGLYKQQFAQGGLNDLQRAGMESQRQTYASPQFTQGYDAMRSMGMGLMGGGVAQNPFNSGGGQQIQQRPMGGQQMQPMRPNTNMAYQPYQPQQNPALAGMNTPIQSVSQYQAQAPAAPAPQSVDDMIDAYMKENGLGKYAANTQGNSPYLSDGLA